MSGFFTLPASQRKRKRAQPPSANSSRKRRDTRDESISGSESEGEARKPALSEASASSESDDEDEDAAGRRTRLAERYLENTRQQILAEGFDAADIDAELLAERTGERLKEDTAESKGKLYRWIADDYNFTGATHAQFRPGTIRAGELTGVAVCPPYIYTTTKNEALIKWEMPSTAGVPNGNAGDAHAHTSKKPKQILQTRGFRQKAGDPYYQHHTNAILCVAASADGKFVATGGQDRKLIIWDAATLRPLKVFPQHRDAVTSLVFRRGTNQLFSASKDRTVKIWSLDELAYVETLFGHQDEVLDVAALNQEKCVTVGARDRTARLWRVVEESQLVFRGGGMGSSSKKRNKADGVGLEEKSYNEGSIDRVVMIDDETFVTGSDNGNLSLWNTQKKKAVFVYPLAHGVDPPPRPDELDANVVPNPDIAGDPQPRWITALACVPFSNILVSGSWDGEVRIWKISEDKRRIEPLGAASRAVDQSAAVNGLSNGDLTGMADGVMIGMVEHDGHGEDSEPEEKTFKGVINDLAVFEKGERGKDGLGIVAVGGKEHRLGGWVKMPAKHFGMIFDVPKTV